MSSAPTLIGTTHVARRLNISPTTVTRMAADGRLTPVAKLPTKNGAFLFDEAEVDRLAQSLAAEAS